MTMRPWRSMTCSSWMYQVQGSAMVIAATGSSTIVTPHNQSWAAPPEDATEQRDEPVAGAEGGPADAGLLPVGHVPGDERVEPDPEDPEADVGRGEQCRAAAGGIRDRDGHEESDHGADQRGGLNVRMGRVSAVERPGELVSRPRDEPEGEHRATEPSPSEVVDDEVEDPGGAEDEDEIE